VAVRVLDGYSSQRYRCEDVQGEFESNPKMIPVGKLY
jgi:hypothetical protein